MASSLAPASVFDDYRFRTEFNQTLFESIVRKKKVTPKVGFNLDEDEYPQIKEQMALRGWRRLAALITDISKLLVQEFYANAAISDEEMEDAGDGRPAAALATGTKPILSNGRMGGINPVPNVLCIHNNKEPRSQQNSSKSRITGKNSPW
ncbi:hypothetical protein PIB30_076934 [Stylosanthes scabra]|uniref:Uncharacterized protein n=1 Tax=Stylosanthes scabra TaxID=79078 RepID=A0ABU6RQZ1_9FABA|nr:hypothetical protein [Stylosanthes scabra]